MRKKMWVVVCASVMMTFASTQTVRAEEEVSKNTWINMEKGPAVAQWVDENGTVSEQAGVKPGTQSQPVGPGEGLSSQDSETEGNGQTAEETGTENDVQAAQETGAENSAQAAQEAGAENNVQAESEEANEQAQAGAASTAGRQIDPNRPMVALTFDDGPYAPVGNQIMDCLAQYGGKATFYVVGNRCAAYAAEMQRMAAEGHEIGNHTYEHKYLNQLTAEQIQYQINKGNEAILASSGTTAPTIRLPGGNKNATVMANVNAPVIMWSIDTLDWKTRNTQSTVDKVLGSVKDGDIILMHELYSQTGNAAVQIIPALVERGYQLVTVSELAQYRGGLENGKIYSAFRP